MADLKMPELNSIIIAGNLTKDPVFRETTNKTPVVNFHVAANRRYKDSQSLWQEDVCYVGVVAWNKLAESCKDRLKKGSAVLVDGELQSRTFKTEDGRNRTIVEIKAKRIQFLNKINRDKSSETHETEVTNKDVQVKENTKTKSDYEDNSFDKFLNDEESDLIKGK